MPLHSSTWDVFYKVYNKVSIGGFVILDYSGCYPECLEEALAFLEAHDMADSIVSIDENSIYWRKNTDASVERDIYLLDHSLSVTTKASAEGTEWVPSGNAGELHSTAHFDQSNSVEHDHGQTDRLHGEKVPSKAEAVQCTSGPTFGMNEFRRLVPPAGGEMAFIYSCKGGQPCGGLADRMIGMVSVFILAVLTNRSFAIEIDQPAMLQNFLIPNEYDWTIPYPHTDVLHWVDKCMPYDPDFTTVNLEEEFEQHVVRIQVNMELFSRLRQNPLYAQYKDILHLNLWFPHFYQIMFTPSASTYAAGRDIFHKMMSNDVACAQMRLLTNDKFSAPESEYDEDLEEEFLIPWTELLYTPKHTLQSNEARGPQDFLMQIQDVNIVWDLLSALPEDKIIFVSSDSKGIIMEAKSRFGNRLLVIDQDITHIEAGPSDSNFAYTYATFHAFQYCKSMVFSRSGFGELGAALLNKTESTVLVLQTRGRSWHLDPCKFYAYKEECGAWSPDDVLFAGYEEYMDSMTVEMSNHT
jgi:hypothetical protein